MDVQMPIMDGIEATQRLKGQGKLRHIPVIAYTAFRTALPSHDLFDAVLTKPYSPEDVLTAVAQSKATAAKRPKARSNGGKGS